MLTDALACPLCYFEYDSSDRLPRLLLCCGHTLCSKCLSRLLSTQTSLQCPFDQQTFPAQDGGINAFPVNSALKQCLEEKLNTDICKIHHQEVRLICLSDKAMICDACALSGEHNGHKMQSMSRVKQEANERKNQLREVLGKIKAHQSESDSLLEKRKAIVSENIREKFKEVRKVFLCSEMEIMSRIDTFMRLGKEKVIKDLGMGTEIKKELSTKLDEQSSILKSSNFFDLMEEDLSTSLSKVKTGPLDDCLQGITQNLDKISGSIKNAFFQESLSLTHLADKVQSKIGEEYKVEAEAGTSQNLGAFQLLTNLKFEAKEGSVSVTFADGSPQPTVINLEEWKDIPKIKLYPGYYDITQEDFQLFHYLWYKLEKLRSVVIKFTTLGISDDVVIKVLPILLNRQKGLEEIEIWFEDCKLTDKSTNFFFSQVLSKMTDLKQLKIILDSTEITNNCLKVLSDEVLSPTKDLKALEFVRIDLFNTKINDDGVIQLFQSIERLQEFNIHLQSTNITDRCLESFARNTLPNMKALQKLGIWLGKTSITDTSIIEIFNQLQDLNEFKIALMETKTTDACVKVFLETTMPRLVSLKSLYFNIKNSNISEEMGVKLKEIENRLTEDGKKSTEA